jgi:hypothetical protein
VKQPMKKAARQKLSKTFLIVVLPSIIGHRDQAMGHSAEPYVPGSVPPFSFSP